jgi:transposase
VASPLEELSREELMALVRQLIARVAELERILEEVRRGGKRQSAPFSKGTPKTNPKRPGRKKGAAYGKQATRPVPPRVDQHIVVECPLFCPDCNAPVEVSGRADQYQTDIPQVKPWTRHFEIHFGRCTGCGRRVQKRDRRQTSDAVGVGGVQIGPVAIGMAAHLNKMGGLSYEKEAALFERMFGFKVSRSTLTRGLLRLAKKAAPSYEVLKGQLRTSAVVYPDETGWKIGGQSAWLHGATDGKATTVYAIEKGRGYPEAARLLGKDYAGTIGSDGWAPYRKFTHASRQACLAHLLRRSKELLETATGSSVRFPRAVRTVLKRAFAVRDLRDAGTLSRTELKLEKAKLDHEIGCLLVGHFTNEGNRLFAKHLSKLREDLFRFVDRPELEGTNWPAETELRYAVVNRKTCGGGNRTMNGATAQAVLMTLSRTARKRSHDDISMFADLLRAPRPLVHPLLLERPP